MTRHRINYEAENSEEAIDSIDAATDRQAVLEIIRTSPRALGASEIADIMGRTLFSIRPRVSNLKKDGLIQSVGRRPLPGGTHEAIYVVPVIIDNQVAFPFMAVE